LNGFLAQRHDALRRLYRGFLNLKTVRFPRPKAHTEALNQASGSFRSQLKSIGAFTQDIRKHLDDGISSYNHVKTDLEAGREMFRKTCEDLDGRINGVQLRRDWLAWLGLIAIGMVIGIAIGVVLEAKFR